MASGFTPPSDDRSRTTRGSEDSVPVAGSRDLVPAVSVVKARTQSRPRAQAKAQAGSEGSSTPSPQQQGVTLSAQQATLLAGASIQRAHQASEMVSAAACSALQGHQAAVFAQARQRFVESEANQVVDQVRSEARSFGHHVVTETQAEALRFRQELEGQEVLASATQAVSQAEARSRETEALARQEAMELQAQLSGARNALGESHDQTRMLNAQVQQLQNEKSQLAARLERIEALLASRTPVPSVATPRHPQSHASPGTHYPQMAFAPDQMSPNATVQHHAEHLPPTQHSQASPPTEQPVERTAQPVRLQALFEGAASGAPVLGREGSPTAQPVSSLPQESDDWARDCDLFGPDQPFLYQGHRLRVLRMKLLSRLP